MASLEAAQNYVDSALWVGGEAAGMAAESQLATSPSDFRANMETTGDIVYDTIVSAIPSGQKLVGITLLGVLYPPAAAWYGTIKLVHGAVSSLAS